MRGIKEEVRIDYLAAHNGKVGCPCCGMVYKIQKGMYVPICCHGVRMRFINVPETEFTKMFGINGVRL